MSTNNYNSNLTQTDQVQEEEIDIKKIIYVIIRQWYWFLLFGILGISGAFLLTKVTKQQYQINASILVPEKTNGLGLDMKNLFNGVLDQNKNNIYNQIEIVKSYYIINQTLQNLNWRTSWFQKDLFVWREIYHNEPFVVKEEPAFNAEGINIYISPTTSDTYKITVDGETMIQKELKTIKFEALGTFGKPFTNSYFNFTLSKKTFDDQALNDDFYFTFNNLNDATLSYQKKLDASLKDKNSDIIISSIQGENPVKEADFLNQLIEVYSNNKMSFQNESQRRSLEFINNQLSGISDSLNIASNKFTDFRTNNKIIDLGEQGKLVMNKLKDIESDEASSKMQLDYFKKLYEYLRNATDYKKIVAPSVVGVQDAALNSLVVQLGELYNRRQIIAYSAKENNPTLILLDQQLTQIRNTLIENLRNLIDNATNNIKNIKDQQNEISVQLNKLPAKEQKMITIQRQFDLTNEIYTFLLQKRAETNIALASSTSDIQVIDIARPETAIKIGIAPKMKLLIGFFIGLLLPLGLIFIKNFFDDRIHSQEDVEKNTQLPILGNIIHSTAKTDIAVYESPKSNTAESFRGFRTNLQFMLTRETGNVISVHSTTPGEGKSFISTNLASILAMNDKKVVLIGADLRKPRLHKIFNFENDKGLCTYLIGYDPLDQVLRSTQVDNLWVINSGPIPPNPAELLGHPQMKVLLDELRQRFDYIVIDNAPIGLVTDGLILGKSADLNVFLLRYGVSHKSQIKLINEIAAKHQISHCAIVVNDISTKSFGYTYYKYYHYEYYQNTYYSYSEDEGTKKRRKHKKSEKA
jgi:capsular exopolysaccharide synthesis family protein